jgi:ribonuclease-3
VSTGHARNHERLEFLGDAVLRLAATEFIDRHHPDLTVGACSNLRAQLVSDRWLANLGEQLNLDPLILLGNKAKGDVAARATLRADTTEALIGALYAALGNLEMIHLWLTPHWQRTTAEVLADPHRGNHKSALQEWSQSQRLGLPQYLCTETNRRHGDPRRFHCRVSLPPALSAEGWGGSRREAEQQAAGRLLNQLPSS